MTRLLLPLDEDERLVAEVRCDGDGGKCSSLLGHVRHRRGAPGLLLTLNRADRWEGWCPLTFEGGTDLFWCAMHPVVTVDGERRSYKTGLGSRWVDYSELRPVYEKFTRTGQPQPWMLTPTAPPPGVPRRPPKRGIAHRR